MSNKNQHGLSRHIPDDVKSKIRVNSKFCCVVPNCRNPFYEYEHIIPEFKDAQEHDPDKMCLVCPQHNPRKQGKDGQEMFSKEQLQKFYDNLRKSNPEDATTPEDKSFFSGFDKPPVIQIGASSFENVYSIINIDGDDMLSFTFNRDAGLFEPAIIFTGAFKNSEGDLVFSIDKNHWKISNSNHDVTVKNGEIQIYEDENKVVFGMKKIPKDSRIEITHLDLWYPPFRVFIENGSLWVGKYSISNEDAMLMNIDGVFQHSKCGVYLTNEELVYHGVTISGNSGAELTGNGVYLGKGGGILRLQGGNLSVKGNVRDESHYRNLKVKLPKGANYFIKGIVHEVDREFPLWTEKEYYLGGVRLESGPTSWGQVEDGDHIYYISHQESPLLLSHKGFLGHYADDLLDTPYAEFVFNVMVEDEDESGNKYPKTVKAFQAKNYRMLQKFDENGRPIVPQVFAGMSPWKADNT